MRRLIQAISRHHFISVVLVLSTFALSACRDDLRTITSPDKPSALIVTKPPCCSTQPPYYLQQYLDQFIDISAGEKHTCAIKRNGNIYCWGDTYRGQSGAANATCSNDPCVTVPSFITAASQMESGFDHTCAINSVGAALCWGDGSHGEIGLGAQGGYYKGANPSPVMVAPTTGGVTLAFNSISAGKYSTCGTTVDGIYCWGIISGWRTEPTLVLSSTGFSGATVGYDHGCAIYTGNGGREVRCWGANELGSVGLPLNVFDFTGLVTAPLGTSVNRVTTQGYFTCADQASGVVQCMGDNLHGQLANGSSGTYAFTNIPQTVPGALSGVATSSSHACALDPNGHAFCWGYGADGQIGNGAQSDALSPQAVNTTMTFRAIAAGDHHTCAIGTDNRIYCWGSNTYGQLGNGVNSGGTALTPQPTL